MKLPAFELDGQPVLALPEIVPAASYLERVDWEAILESNFGREEKQLLEAKLDGLTHCETARALGWKAAKLKRIAKRIERKLSQGPLITDDVPVLRRASGCAFEEQLPSGRKVWSMTPANPAEPHILRKERRTIFASKS